MTLALISALTLGQSLLAAYLLATKARRINSLYLPLAGFFLINAAIQLYFILREPSFIEILSVEPATIILVKQVIELNMAPLFWVYIRVLTSEKKPIFDISNCMHFALPLVIALLLATILLKFDLVSNAQAQQHTKERFIATLNSVLNLVILTQLLGYACLVIRRLVNYQKRLKDVFANLEQLMDLSWFRWVLAIILFTLALEVISQLLDISVDVPHGVLIWNSLLRAAIVWSLAIWGLQQTPDLMIELEQIHKQQNSKKYEKSALSSEQLFKVAEKIRKALEQGLLYRDPQLSLRTLAKHINVLPNYASQALNTEIKESFFDYVNRLRIQDAMSQLKTSEETVLAISSSVGFNSRSSFYNAFKKISGTTPTAYRQINS